LGRAFNGHRADHHQFLFAHRLGRVDSTAQQVRCFRYGNIENRAEESFGLLDDDYVSHHQF
jgi:hypothetical protein